MSDVNIEPHSGVSEIHMVHWFRKGLRLHDNPALREGLKGAQTFRCVFILDPWFAGSSNVGINKWRYVTLMYFKNYRTIIFHYISFNAYT